jgi:hypothetical protein
MPEYVQDGTVLFRLLFPELLTDIFQVNQQLPVLFQLGVMFSNSLRDAFPCRLQFVKYLHHQMNFCHVPGGIWDWPYILPSEFNLAKPMTANKSQ